jgi:hypothetical protein
MSDDEKSLWWLGLAVFAITVATLAYSTTIG